MNPELDKTCITCRHWDNPDPWRGDCALQLPPWVDRTLELVTQGDRRINKYTGPGETCSFWEAK